MSSSDPVREFLAEIAARLDKGREEYGDQSFVKPVSATTREILEEQADQVGWLYVLWCQAARKTDMVRDQLTLRGLFLSAIEHRIRRNDRRQKDAYAVGALNCMEEIEVLALDLFLQGQELKRRLLPIARAIEVAQVIHADPHQYLRGRRGSVRDPRSDD